MNNCERKSIKDRRMLHIIFPRKDPYFKYWVVTYEICTFFISIFKSLQYLYLYRFIIVYYFKVEHFFSITYDLVIYQLIKASCVHLITMIILILYFHVISFHSISF